MAVLSPEEKRQHFLSSRRVKESPAGIHECRSMNYSERVRASNAIRDEIEQALRLRRAQAKSLEQASYCDITMPRTAREMRKAARAHRRMWWLSITSAVREFAVLLADANGTEPLSFDEADACSDEDTRSAASYLVTIGRAALERRGKR